ncbi:uncharacterized protein I303_101078 [Kwoniella dejecticola CBS 10117]|uniref:Uncharacterized protein n=1 Tax=Kwoniella dejecticola CBS 10117 TaxID=1296121 RepID=A0A1A6AGR7_9TREE|nr:uncharacterized protein I303_01081 [Kwoniella dejecticola CBS 10117]OBR89256.1 hypothetical protein I303_01081 [Kwoniella dejecticola CBS 10117]
MVKRSPSTSPSFESEAEADIKSAHIRDQDQASKTPKKPPKKSLQEVKSELNNERESWTPEKKHIVVEALLDAGYGSLDFKAISERTGLTPLQLRDALKKRPEGKTNLRSKIIASVNAK